MMSCPNCQKHLLAYIHGELPAGLKRQITLHLQDCTLCYMAYSEHRDLADDLTAVMPLVGADFQPRFERVWAALQPTDLRPQPRYPRYGLAVLAMTLALLLPWTVKDRSISFAAPPTQPSPLTLVVNQTPASAYPAPTATVAALSVTANDQAATPNARLYLAAPVPTLTDTP